MLRHCLPARTFLLASPEKTEDLTSVIWPTRRNLRPVERDLFRLKVTLRLRGRQAVWEVVRDTPSTPLENNPRSMELEANLPIASDLGCAIRVPGDLRHAGRKKAGDTRPGSGSPHRTRIAFETRP